MSRFAPGQSGNPGGRPKGLAAYAREQLGDDGKRIFDFMLSVMDNELEDTKLRMDAARWCADRAFGKPVQSVEHMAGDAPVAVEVTHSVDDLARVAQILTSAGAFPAAGGADS
jgi:hypothetical protein